MRRRIAPVAGPGKEVTLSHVEGSDVVGTPQFWGTSDDDNTLTISESCLTQLSAASSSSQSETIAMTPSASSAPWTPISR